ncbi:transposase, partial [Salinispora cortesiana]
RLWRTSWPQFVPFLDYDHEVRKVLYTTNIIESLNARFRQAARRRGHFPTEQAAMKVLYLVVQQKRKSGSITGRVYGWAKALNALILAYGDRITI